MKIVEWNSLSIENSFVILLFFAANFELIFDYQIFYRWLMMLTKPELITS